MTDEQTDIATNCRILLFDVIQSLRHLPVLGLREHDGEGPGGDPHHGKDEGGDGGVDVSQGGHRGGEGPAYLGDQGGGAHSCSPHGGRHQLSWEKYKQRFNVLSHSGEISN